MSHAVHNSRAVLLAFPHADWVCAIGKFNNWSTTATPLTRIGENEWELQMPRESELEQLSFFVIAEGDRFGRVMNCWTLFK